MELPLTSTASLLTWLLTWFSWVPADLRIIGVTALQVRLSVDSLLNMVKSDSKTSTSTQSEEVEERKPNPSLILLSRDDDAYEDLSLKQVEKLVVGECSNVNSNDNASFSSYSEVIITDVREIIKNTKEMTGAQSNVSTLDPIENSSFFFFFLLLYYLLKSIASSNWKKCLQVRSYCAQIYWLELICFYFVSFPVVWGMLNRNWSSFNSMFQIWFLWLRTPNTTSKIHKKYLVIIFFWVITSSGASIWGFLDLLF